MIIKDCPLSGLKTVQLKIFGDKRGFFTELFNARDFEAGGLPTVFAQDNHSRSAPGTLRGLHYQASPAQGKLVGVMRGRILDVAVDIRPDSPTFGKYHAEELSDENGMLLWVPAGFAHGFCVLGDESVDVLYKVTSFYNPKSENGIRYDDTMLNIPWSLKNPTVSDRDKNLQSWTEYCVSPAKWEQA